jgi:predicted DNA-binding protein (MmcQ/YjbR family)
VQGPRLEREVVVAEPKNPSQRALTTPGAEPAGYGLGKAGWVRIPLDVKGAPGAALLCDWVEESYRTVATKKLVAELDAR